MIFIIITIILTYYTYIMPYLVFYIIFDALNSFYIFNTIIFSLLY